MVGDDEALLREHARALARDTSPLAGPGAAYGGYAERVAHWIDLVDRGARVVHLGQTALGVPIFGVELGPVDARRASILVAGLHAMEWIGVAVGEALLDRLVASPPRDRRVLAVPLANPDGYRSVEDDLRARRLRFRRTNTRGVDLNRNWPTHHHSWSLRSMLVPPLGGPGRTPMSEPEVAGVVAWGDRVVKEGARVDRALSLHSYGRMILYPYGGRWRAPEELARLRAAARSVAARIAGRYRVVQVARWVPGAFAHGMEVDTMHARWGATALLVECSAGGLSLGAPSSVVQPFCWFNPAEPLRDVEELAPALELFLRGGLEA